jgi:2-keto-4-pentenoate hydratase/2-oxohepta-3-ene-1,7-dioic acid hydratase in catechol pathway
MIEGHKRADGRPLLKGRVRLATKSGVVTAFADENGELINSEGDAVSGSLVAPCVPTKIVGIGTNYRSHALEMGKPIPSVPKIFLKPTSSILSPNGVILLPDSSNRVDYEAEVGVVIAKKAQSVSVAEAMDYVLGFTAVNDVTCRDHQIEDGVFGRAKGHDTHCPIGPSIVSGLDHADIDIRCEVNGEVRQQGNTSDLIFSIPQLVSFVSGVMTLMPGDVIATGTPSGVGPLASGDTVDIFVNGVGVLTNTVE